MPENINNKLLKGTAICTDHKVCKVCHFTSDRNKKNYDHIPKQKLQIGFCQVQKVNWFALH